MPTRSIHSINLEDDDEDAFCEPTACKRLRSYKSDLTVVLRFESSTEISNDDSQGTDFKSNVNSSKQIEIEISMYGPILAKLSTFIDAMLAAGMKEQKTRRIVLDDVTPQVFDAGLKFLEDPMAARSMKGCDVKQVVKFYDKYGFEGGLSLCDKVLYQELEQKTDASWDPASKTYPAFDLEGIVDAIGIAEQYQLKASMEHGARWVNQVFNDRFPHLNPSIFSIRHLTKLHCLFKTKRIVDGFLDLIAYTEEELHSTLFPQLVHSLIQLEYSQQDMHKFWLKDCPDTLWGNANGLYRRCSPGVFVKTDKVGSIPIEQLSTFVVKRETSMKGDWIICLDTLVDSVLNHDRKATRVLWRNYYSSELSQPPSFGWTKIDSSIKNSTVSPVVDVLTRAFIPRHNR